MAKSVQDILNIIKEKDIKMVLSPAPGEFWQSLAFLHSQLLHTPVSAFFVTKPPPCVFLSHQAIL